MGKETNVKIFCGKFLIFEAEIGMFLSFFDYLSHIFDSFHGNGCLKNSVLCLDSLRFLKVYIFLKILTYTYRPVWSTVLRAGSIRNKVSCQTITLLKFLWSAGLSTICNCKNGGKLYFLFNFC